MQMAVALVLAQLTMHDGFEQPLVLDGTVWSSLSVSVADGPLDAGIVSSAGHRGAGFRVEDEGAGVGSASVAYLERDFAGTGAQYVRTWFHAQPAAGDGTMTLIGVHIDSPSGTGGEILWDTATGELYLQCFDGSGALVSPNIHMPAVDGWHLLELSVEGVGVADGACAMWLDGERVGGFTPIDYGGSAFHLTLIGEPFAQRSFQGVLDFDDFAASPQPIASTVRLTAPPLVVGACVDARIDFIDSVDAGVRPLSSAVTLGFAFDGGIGATLCSPATSAPQGATSLTVGLRAASAGIGTVTVLADDLLPAQFALTAGDGRPEEPRAYRVGCGCGTGGEQLALLAALLTARRRVRRRS